MSLVPLQNSVGGRFVTSRSEKMSCFKNAWAGESSARVGTIIMSIQYLKDGHPAIYMPTLLPPPSCESKRITRADDTEEVVKERLHVS